MTLRPCRMQSTLEVSPVIGVEPDASFSRSQSVNHGLCHPSLWGAPTYVDRFPHNRTDDFAIGQGTKLCRPCSVSRSRRGSGLGALMRLPRFCICCSKLRFPPEHHVITSPPSPLITPDHATLSQPPKPSKSLPNPARNPAPPNSHIKIRI